MLQINMADVANILTVCIPYLTALAIILVLAIVVTIAVMKRKKPTKYLLRRQSWITVLLAVIVVANMICMGPMASMLTLVTGNGTITQESSDRSEALVQQIAEEGAVLLKNEDSLLPLETDHHLNLFGWSSTNPTYGGMGSGALSDSYPLVTLEEGLTNAGFELNTEISDFYRTVYGLTL